MEEEALYVRDGDGYVGTILTQGGWDPHGANGGTVLALLGHCLEDVPTLVPMSVSRFTADLVRPVPIGRRLEIRSSVLREGKKIQLVQLVLVADDVEHVRATVLRLRDADLGQADGGDVPPSTSDHRPADALLPPEQSIEMRTVSPTRPGFLKAVDLRRTRTPDGTTGAWVRLDAAVVAGEPVRPTARLALAIDFANLVGLDGPVAALTMINPDVTAHVLRPPRDESDGATGWVAITGDTRFHPASGRGISSAVLSDDDGVFAVASTSQLIQPRA
jgi:hypothetical protein